MVPVTIPAGGKLTVVGDLHGGLGDLLHILRTRGMPRDEHAAGEASGGACAHFFLFNGDLVDRGAHGLEVTLLLALLKLAHPRAVFCNRGNHEDVAVNAIYNFAGEIVRKWQTWLPPLGIWRPMLVARNAAEAPCSVLRLF